MSNSLPQWSKYDPRKPLTKPGLLLVEGADDYGFFRWLLGTLDQCSSGVDIRTMGGRDQLRQSIAGFAAMTGFNRVHRLLVVADADTDPQAQFDSIVDALRHNRLPAPSSQGLWAVGNNVRVAVNLINGKSGTGSIEDLCIQCLSEHAYRPCAESLLECAAKAGADIETNRSKRLLHACLALRPELRTHIGTAADNGAFSPSADALSHWKVLLQALAGTTNSD